jgi:chemotaxis-related protein WspB
VTLFVIFRVGGELYGLRATEVERFVPLVNLRNIPHTPSFVRGIFDLQGEVVPVLDLEGLLLNGKTPCLMSARVIVVRFPCANGDAHTLGLLASSIVEMLSVDESLLAEPALRTEGAPYLGQVLKHQEGLVHIVELSSLIPEPLQQALFVAGEEVG